MFEVEPDLKIIDPFHKEQFIIIFGLFYQHFDKKNIQQCTLRSYLNDKMNSFVRNDNQIDLQIKYQNILSKSYLLFLRRTDYIKTHFKERQHFIQTL